MRFRVSVLALDLLEPTEADEEGSRYFFDFIDENRIGMYGIGSGSKWLIS